MTELLQMIPSSLTAITSREGFKGVFTNQCPDYYSRKRGHDKREQKYRPSLEHSLHDSLGGIG